MTNITGLWVVINFLIYLFKDKDFNYLSLLFFSVSLILTFILSIINIRYKIKTIKQSISIKTEEKSRFAQKLEKLQEEQKLKWVKKS